jgi:hypothetical protein
MGETFEDVLNASSTSTNDFETMPPRIYALHIVSQRRLIVQCTPSLYYVQMPTNNMDAHTHCEETMHRILTMCFDIVRMTWSHISQSGTYFNFLSPSPSRVTGSLLQASLLGYTGHDSRGASKHSESKHQARTEDCQCRYEHSSSSPLSPLWSSMEGRRWGRLRGCSYYANWSSRRDDCGVEAYAHERPMLVLLTISRDCGVEALPHEDLLRVLHTISLC